MIYGKRPLSGGVFHAGSGAQERILRAAHAQGGRITKREAIRLCGMGHGKTLDALERRGMMMRTNAYTWRLSR